MFEKQTSTLLCFLKTFLCSNNFLHEYICEFLRSMNSKEVEKDAHLERTERERDGSRNDPPRRLLISLRVKTGWKRSRFLGVSGWQRWFFIALHENNLSSSFSLSLSLSCSHSLTLFVLFSRLLWCPELKRARAEAFPVAEAARQISSPFVLPLARWQLVNSV